MGQFEDKINLLQFIPDENNQHIVIINEAECQKCTSKPCLTICPSVVFTWNNCDHHPVLVSYKQCIECGACRLICPLENIEFSFPNGGFGVIYHNG